MLRFVQYAALRAMLGTEYLAQYVKNFSKLKISCNRKFVFATRGARGSLAKMTCQPFFCSANRSVMLSSIRLLLSSIRCA